MSFSSVRHHRTSQDTFYSIATLFYFLHSVKMKSDRRRDVAISSHQHGQITEPAKTIDSLPTIR